MFAWQKLRAKLWKEAAAFNISWLMWQQNCVLTEISESCLPEDDIALGQHLGRGKLT